MPKQYSSPPAMQIDVNKQYTATIETNKGTIVAELYPKDAPTTVNSFVFLARERYFDGIMFHRIIPGFVIQGGDPEGTGMGGPGYKTVDTPPRNAAYTKGVVAMAKAGPEKPGTAGSQFFVVTGEDVGLPPDYAVLGKVTDGLDVVEAIGKLGDANEQPTQAVTIEGAEVKSG